MEPIALHGDTNIRYQRLQSIEDDKVETNKDTHEISSVSPGSYWHWWNFADKSNGYNKLTIERVETPLKRIRKTNLKGAILSCLCILMVVLALWCYFTLKPFGEEEDELISRIEKQPVLLSEDDSLMESWEKYADEFFTFDGLGTRKVYTSPDESTFNCVQPGMMTILINSSTAQIWDDFKVDKSCSDLLIIERLELSGFFSYEDLQHILEEIPNISSLKFLSLSLESYEPQIDSVKKEKIKLSILTSLSIIEATGEGGNSLFKWIDEVVEMPFLSEVLIMKSDIVAEPVNSIVESSVELKSLFLIGNNIECEDFGPCPAFTTEMTNLVELVLINGNSKQNDYWAQFINNMLLKVENNKALRILESNIPTDITTLKILIDSELRLGNRQVYEIAFRLPAVNSTTRKEFAENQTALFEKYYGIKCAKAPVDEKNSQLVKINQWVNLCQDSQHNIMYGFNKAKFIQDSHLTIFIRRAQTGTVVCYDNFNVNKQSDKNGDFSCQNHF